MEKNFQEISDEMYYEKMVKIRIFEQKVEEYFSKGLMRGTTHGYVGMEAIAVGVLTNIDPRVDFVTSTHRCHGHFLTLFDDAFSLACELMGKRNGVVGGKGGSQHIQKGNFLANGITGGMVPVAVGIGLSKKLKGEPGVVLSFLGDGAMNEGYVLEAFNLAKVFKTPNIFILENNVYAMSTVTQNLTSSTFEERVRSFNITFTKLKALDVREVAKVFRQVYERVRTEREPAFVEFETYRLCGHSKSDKREYVLPELERFWLENDPLKRLEDRLEPNVVEKIKEKVVTEIEEAFKRAENDAEPDIEDLIS